MTEPDQAMEFEIRVTLDRSECTRLFDTGETSRRGAIEVEGRVRVLLEVGRRDIRIDRPLDRAPDDIGLVLTGRDQRDLSRFEDRPDAECDRLDRDIVLAEEVLGRGPWCHRVVLDEAGPLVDCGAGLIEADMPCLSDPEYLEVDPPCGSDPFLVLAAVCGHFLTGQVAARDIEVLGPDIYMVEEVFGHEAAEAMDTVGVHRIVLIEVEGDDIREVEPLLLV